MATDQSFMQFVYDNIKSTGEITYRKMFGEYAVYFAGKVFALVCENQFYLKPTEGGRKMLGESIKLAPPFPGAKNYFVLEEEQLNQRQWITEIILMTASELPEPKAKKSVTRKSRKKKT